MHASGATHHGRPYDFQGLGLTQNLVHLDLLMLIALVVLKKPARRLQQAHDARLPGISMLPAEPTALVMIISDADTRTTYFEFGQA